MSTPEAPDLRDQIAQLVGVIQHELELARAGDGYEEQAVAEEIVAKRVAPLLAAKDQERDDAMRLAEHHLHERDEFVRVWGERARVQAERADALSALLRGMARRSNSWRRISVKRINRYLAAKHELTEARDDAKNAREDSARRAQENARLRADLLGRLNALAVLLGLPSHKVDTGFYGLCQALDDRHTATVRERDEARARADRVDREAAELDAALGEARAEVDKLRTDLAETREQVDRHRCTIQQQHRDHVQEVAVLREERDIAVEVAERVARDTGKRTPLSAVEATEEIRERYGAAIDLLGELELYVRWRHVTGKLTTEQRELWADACERWQPDPSTPVTRTVDRWWRNDEPAPDLAGLAAREATLANNAPNDASPQVNTLAKPRRDERIDQTGLYAEPTDPGGA